MECNGRGRHKPWLPPITTPVYRRNTAHAHFTLPLHHHSRVLAQSASAQSHLLYYKFDRGTGSDAVNYGTTGTTTNWVSPGQYGPSMLSGSANNSGTDFSYCDTGWSTGFTGDFTMHWWMKESSAPGTGLSYVFGGIGSFRCFTNGVAGTTLWVRAYGAATDNIILPTVGDDLQVRARAAGGVCVGLVVSTNAIATTAQWYIDGAAHGPAQTLTTTPTVGPGTSSFKIGRHTSNTSSSTYDFDEFRLCDYAATPAEIASWC